MITAYRQQAAASVRREPASARGALCGGSGGRRDSRSSRSSRERSFRTTTFRISIRRFFSRGISGKVVMRDHQAHEPCGAANCGDAAESFTRARRTDETSAFGSVVAFNDVVDRQRAETCGEIFLEVIVARGFKQDALELFAKKKNLRLVTIPADDWDKANRGLFTKEIGELLLVQDRDEGFPELESCRVVDGAQTFSRGGSGAQDRLEDRETRAFERHRDLRCAGNDRCRSGADEQGRFVPHRRG